MIALATGYRPGTVVRYAPDPTRFEPRWCREGTAIADDRGRLVDTYWETGSEAHLVTAAEAPSVEVLFHLEDFDELDRWRPDMGKWLTYAEADRRRITSQHGLSHRLFIRKDAAPHRETIIDNLREKVSNAESEVERAQGHLRWAQEDLDAILAAPENCACRPSLCAKDGCPACAGADWRACKALPARLRGA